MAAGSLKTAKLQVRNRKSVKEMSNGLDLTIHGSSLLLKDSPTNRSLSIIEAKIIIIYVSIVKARQKIG